MMFLINQSLYFILPLLIVALAGMFSEKSGTVNIALEGIMVIGAFAGIYFIYSIQNTMSTPEVFEALSASQKRIYTYFSNNPQLMLIVAMILAALAGMAFSALLGFLSINMKANQTIGGVALNILAGALAIFMARTLTDQGVSHLKFDNVFRFRSNAFINLFPNVQEGTFGYKVVEGINYIFFSEAFLFTYISIAIFLVSAFIIKRTRFGMRLSACGEHPQAAQSVGINVYKYRWAGVLISGALGGFGGLIYIIPTSVSFHGTVNGYGFLALAVLIFGQWKPVKILFAAIFFGLFQMLSINLFTVDTVKVWLEANNKVPLAMIIRIMPFLITLIALSLTSKSSRAPKASGVPFDPKGS